MGTYKTTTLTIKISKKNGKGVYKAKLGRYKEEELDCSQLLQYIENIIEQVDGIQTIRVPLKIM